MMYALNVDLEQKKSARHTRRLQMSDELKLDPYLQRMVEAGMDGADIMHGHLKVLMARAESALADAIEDEEASGEAMDSMERRYWEGVEEAYSELYQLTYAIAFAKEAMGA
jgi:hypothetical protein